MEQLPIFRLITALNLRTRSVRQDTSSPTDVHTLTSSPISLNTSPMGFKGASTGTAVIFETTPPVRIKASSQWYMGVLQVEATLYSDLSFLFNEPRWYLSRQKSRLCRGFWTSSKRFTISLTMLQETRQVKLSISAAAMIS